MEIKFTAEATELNKALGVVSIVSPQVTAQQERGYLFYVSGETCQVYSKNDGHEARASFPITGVEGEGAFMYPADHIEAFGFITGEIAFEVTSEATSQGDDSFRVAYAFGGSGKTEHVSFDPRSMFNFEKDIQKAMEGEPRTFNIKILQTALGMAKSFMAKTGDTVTHEFYKTLQIFGDDDPELAKKANGYLFASNGTEACYFNSDAFLGKGLTAPGQHLPLLEQFMSKSDGALRVYRTDRGVYVVNERDEVVGWPHHMDTYKKFSYYNKVDGIVVQVGCAQMLYQLQYMRAELSKAKKKIRLHFDTTNANFWFSFVDEGNKSTSLPVESEIVKCEVEGEVVASINVGNMIHLFEGAKGDRIEFRILVMSDDKRPKDRYMFRTIDEFVLSEDGEVVGGSGVENVPEGAHVCEVTRFTPGLD